MNHDSDKEMDLLLRRHARQSAPGLAGVAGASAKLDAAHMDADELSAYAEGALPDATRARYISHLADCDSCRRIVAELALSSGIEREERGTVAQTIETPSRSWRGWLAALFSTPMLRYAAPALALVAFASIIFVVITRNREIPSFVAQKETNTQQAANTDAKQQNDEAATSNTGTPGSAGDSQGAPSSANASNAGPNTTPPAPLAARDMSTTPSTETGAVNTADAPKTAAESASAPPPAPAVQENATEAKRAALPAQTVSPADKLSDRAKEKDDSSQNRRENNEVAMDGASAGGTGGRKSQRTETAKRTSALGATTDGTREERQQKEAPRNAPATTARARRDASGADEDSSAAPTRTVAGKRFRQQNGIWVDTSYNSSRSPVKVKRGSEQYRSLVADEPVIGTVANSLGGNVIVVVGGRAYHIY